MLVFVAICAYKYNQAIISVLFVYDKTAVINCFWGTFDSCQQCCISPLGNGVVGWCFSTFDMNAYSFLWCHANRIACMYHNVMTTFHTFPIITSLGAGIEIALLTVLNAWPFQQILPQLILFSICQMYS